LQDLIAIFGPTRHVDPGQECARAVLIIVYAFVVARVAGRRLFGRWSTFDMIVAVTLGSTLSRALTGTAPLGGTLAASTLLVFLHWSFGQAAARWRPLSGFLEGKPVELLREGRVDEAQRKRFSVSELDVSEALSRQGLGSEAEAERLTLSPSGVISAVPKLRREAGTSRG
jgi:uncharacterized membrane protein YcaP (DUF421 family)